jgi:hypothetical protein
MNGMTNSTVTVQPLISRQTPKLPRSFKKSDQICRKANPYASGGKIIEWYGEHSARKGVSSNFQRRVEDPSGPNARKVSKAKQSNNSSEVKRKLNAVSSPHECVMSHFPTNDRKIPIQLFKFPRKVIISVPRSSFRSILGAVKALKDNHGIGIPN